MLGTLIGMALGKYRFRGSGSVTLLLFANIAAPEVVLGAALLSMFLTLDVPRGLLDDRHRARDVQPRLRGGHGPSADGRHGPVARRGRARPRVPVRSSTFFRVTLPLIMPGVLSGALLAFALSIDDYIITSFNAGNTVTFPLWVYGASRTGVPPQVNVMGTLIFAVRCAGRHLRLHTSRRQKA